MSKTSDCGGYYCSEDHGHIDCEPAWCNQWITFEESGWFYYDPGNNRYGPFPTRKDAVSALLADNYD